MTHPPDSLPRRILPRVVAAAVIVCLYVAARPATPSATERAQLASRFRFGTEPLPGLPPLTGGMVGYLGYDVVRRLERLPVLAADDLAVPEMLMLLATDLAAVDHHEGTITLIANAINWDASDQRVDEAYDDAVARLDRMTAELAAPGDTTEASEQLRWVRDEIAALPDTDRRICELCLLQGYSYAEAAQLLGLSVGAVTQRVSRSRRRLKKAVTHDEH